MGFKTIAESGFRLDRRRLMQILIAGSLASPAWAQDAPLAYPFTLGVASGDPSADGFAIWTRLAPHALAPHGGMPIRRLPVRWEIATDDQFKTIVQKGETIARPEFGHAVHAETAGLSPQRPYWYRFMVENHVSATGRTFTAPAAGADVSALRFAVAGCQNYEHGLYTAWRHLAAEEIAFVYHYGDYIYETPYPWRSPVARTRQVLGDECFTLDDYRLRYAEYKTDPDLQAAHAAAPFFVSFDDHEVSNNWVSAQDQVGSPAEAFALRRAMAWQAWAEHMPIRRAQMPTLSGVQVYRRAAYGNLLHAHILDTRQYRTDQPCNDAWGQPRCEGVDARDAQVIGAEAERWLYRNLAANKPAWNVLAQQVMVMNLDRRGADQQTPIYNFDSWAGYETPRQRLLKNLGATKAKNVIVLTGDEHQAFAHELRARSGDPKSPIVAHEFVATSISSGGDGPGVRAEHAAILSNNPDCRLINDKRGYLICDLTPSQWRSTFKIVDKVSTPGSALSTLASFTVERGATGLQKS